MTQKFDPKPQEPRKIDPQYEDTLLGNYYDSGDPEHLAQYVEDGGTLTNGLRDLLAMFIRDHWPKLRNKSNPLRDLAVYDRVETWRKARMNAPIYEHIKTKNLKPREDLFEVLTAFNEIDKNELPKLQDAYRHFTDNDDAIEPETFQKQYERGRKIARGRI